MTHCIPDEQRKVHVVTEAAALIIVAPFMFYVSTLRTLPAWARAMAVGIGVSTVAVDGWLLFRYVKRPSQ